MLPAEKFSRPLRGRAVLGEHAGLEAGGIGRMRRSDARYEWRGGRAVSRKLGQERQRESPPTGWPTDGHHSWRNGYGERSCSTVALSMKRPRPRPKKAHSFTNSSTRISRCPCRTYQSLFPSTPMRRASSVTLMPLPLRFDSIRAATSRLPAIGIGRNSQGLGESLLGQVSLRP